MSKSGFLALSCVGFIASAPALADPLGAPDAASDARDDRDVVVTGERERREADPKDVASPVNTPRSIVTLPADVIERTGSTTLQDALRTVPGITFGAAEGGNPIGDRPFIRGFDSQGSIYVDGVRDLASQTREVFAVDSVQIVRGSDSTLGGRGSAGGTINIISKLPQPRTFANVSGSFGNGDYKRISADANLAVSDTAAFRIEGVWHDQDFAGRDAIWARRWGVAPSVTLGLGTPTRLTASYYYLESHELPDSGLPFLQTITNAPVGRTFVTPALGRITTLDGTTGTVDRATFYGLVNRDFRDTETHQAMLRAEHDFGGVTLRNTARFTHSDQAYIYTQPDDSQGNVFGNPTIARGTVNPITGGARLTGGGYVWRRGNSRYGYTESIIDQTDLYGTVKTGSVEHSFAVGTEFAWEKTRRGTLVSASGATISPRCDAYTLGRYYCTSLFTPNANDPWVNYASDLSNVATPIVKAAPGTETQNDGITQAVYGFDSITLLPQLILNLGARFDRFESKVRTGSPTVTLRRVDELFNWQAGVVFKPTPETSLYFSYATAATPPNSLLGEGREDNALPTTITTPNLTLLDSLEPQKTRSYEVGAKANVLGEKLQLTAAAFQTDIDNARVTGDNNTVSFIGRSRIRGVELTAAGTILPGWTVFGGYTYLDPKILDGGSSALTAPEIRNGPTLVQPAKIVLVPSVNTGQQLPQTAKHSFSGNTNVTLFDRFQIGGTAVYQSRQYGGYADNRSAVQDANGVVTVNPATKFLSRGIPGYWRFDARAAFEVNDFIELAVNAQNLTDKAYYSQTFTTHYATIAPGRTVFGTVNLKF